MSFHLILVVNILVNINNNVQSTLRYNISRYPSIPSSIQYISGSLFPNFILRVDLQIFYIISNYLPIFFKLEVFLHLLLIMVIYLLDIKNWCKCTSRYYQFSTNQLYLFDLEIFLEKATKPI